MLIKKEIYIPAIFTIPDDAALFSILNFKEKTCKKILMENYINFCCYKDIYTGIVLFRFENSVHFESINGLDWCFIPMGMLKKYTYNLDMITQLLIENYAISMPVNKGSIDFYGENAKGTHIMLIYGVDTCKNILLCKDFHRQKFVEFNVDFKSMKESIQNYYNPYSKDSDGLLAFRVNKKTPFNIEYSKVYFEFDKLKKGFVSDTEGFGVGAIDLYLKEIKKYPNDSNLIMSWYVIANYLREASKLMCIRYDILKKDFPCSRGLNFKEYDDVTKKLQNDTDVAFFKIASLCRKDTIVSASLAEELSELIYECRDDFKCISNCFCEMISGC